ncbi:TRAP transporter fused permease subunit [Desulfococcaceae bacterium HSG7]|nr:TRAP transporter fused permease subunit [Desulfococcaceae bacterium HSG7]
MREFKGTQKWIMEGWLVVLSLFQLYTAIFGIFQPRPQRGIHLMFILPAAFILFPAAKKWASDRVPIYDWFLAILALLPPIYLLFNNDYLTERLKFVDPVLPIEMILGALNIILLLEAIRRTVVLAMTILIASFIGYLYIAPFLSGVFYSKAPMFSELVEMHYLITDSGIYGAITGVAATFVALFVIFGAVMETTNTGLFFTDLASRLAGKSKGGPAKIAVISSGLFGSISGVAAANVYSTGTFTIPLMKKLGYRPRFAGAVEASASVGGMMMPPVMGAGAFVMSEITGIPYVKIIIAATLGSLLFYASLVFRVHFTALREELKSMDEKDIKPLKAILKDIYLLVPMVVLVVILLIGYSPFRAAIYAIAICFLFSFFKRENRMTPIKIWETLRLGGQNMIMIGMACAGAGMVVSIVTHTGLALGIATVITNWSGGQLLPALILIMITSLTLGMGLPCTPAYIIAITIGGPALIAMGCDLLSSHMFVYYFAILAGVTPPVCIAAYCGAAIAGSKPLQTGFESLKLALVGFIVPYVFVFNEALLMQGSVVGILTVSTLLLLCVILSAGGLSGYLFKSMEIGGRVVTLAFAIGAAALCTMPNLTDKPLMLAASMTVLLIFWILVFRKKKPLEPVTVEA